MQNLDEVRNDSRKTIVVNAEVHHSDSGGSDSGII